MLSINDSRHFLLYRNFVLASWIGVMIFLPSVICVKAGPVKHCCWSKAGKGQREELDGTESGQPEYEPLTKEHILLRIEMAQRTKIYVWSGDYG